MTDKLEQAGKTGHWYSIYKYISSDEMQERWNITELSPDDSPLELANKLVDHFNKITNLAKPLSRDEIPDSNVGPGLKPQLTVKNATEVIKHYKKCNSSHRRHPKGAY